MKIGDYTIGEGRCFLVAEIGINHNGDVEIAKKLIEAAADAGFDAVKFQKRTPKLCVPRERWSELKETPWGETLPYLDYRLRMEFGAEECDDIDAFCRRLDILWFASVWDMPSYEFMCHYPPTCMKIPSAQLTNDALLKAVGVNGTPVLLSTGMSTAQEVLHAASLVPKERRIFLQCTSCYPAPLVTLDLNVIGTYRREYGEHVGYSGHEVGLAPSIAAVALGAVVLERHVTLDRTMKGSDHAASLEPAGMKRLVRDVRAVERAMGRSDKYLHGSELAARKKLRG